MATGERFETPSGLGGSFTVSIIGDTGGEIVRVRVHYPTKDWDGYEFTTRRDTLRPLGKLPGKRRAA